jgi:uncharacterized protein
MIGKILTFFLGVLFAMGLGISQMTRPEKILSFLNVLGNWDPSLLVVMASAIGVYYPLQLMIRKYQSPLCASDYILPKSEGFDRKLFIGAVCFGLGWGLIGLCPGPSLTIIATLKPEIFVFILAMGAGMLTAHKQSIL